MKTKPNSRIVAILFTAIITCFLSSCNEDESKKQKAETERIEKERLQAEVERTEKERQDLQQKLEEVQNKIVEDAAKAEQAQKDAAHVAENDALRDKLALLENRLGDIKEKQDMAEALAEEVDEPVGTSRYPDPDASTTDRSNQNRYPAGRSEKPRSSRQPAYTENDNRLESKPPVVDDVSYFYEPLAEHGNWINSPDYGYVWSAVAFGDCKCCDWVGGCTNG